MLPINVRNLHHLRSSLRPASLALILMAGVAGPGAMGCYGAATEDAGSPAEALRRVFPENASSVLRSATPFTALAEGFATPMDGDPTEALGRRGGLSAALPKRGEDAIRFHRMGGFECQVREEGARGDGELAEGAVAYPRAGGTSFWSNTEDGYEEWLHVRAGVATGREPVAAWDVDGATLREADGAVEIAGADGVAQIRVTAPVAYASGGRVVPARLTAHGGRIELWVEAEGEALLVDPVWVTVAPLSTGRYYHTATMLPSGRVLAVGGLNASSLALASAELYDPSVNTWSSAGSLTTARYLHTATLLATGKVAVVGGDSSSGAIATAEIYDPTTNAWSSMGSLGTARYAHFAIVLPSGKLLVSGGTTSAGAYLASSQTYDPSTLTWGVAGSMATARAYATVTGLSSGKAVVAGGRNSSGSLASAEIFDQTTDAFSAAGTLSAARYAHTAALLSTGKVLVVGGDGGLAPLTSAELYDATTNTWTTTGSLATARYFHTETWLGSGAVLVAGGYSGAASALASSELYNPTTGTWSAGPTMHAARANAAATQQLSGSQVIMVGGYGATGALASTERFDLGR